MKQALLMPRKRLGIPSNDTAIGKAQKDENGSRREKQKAHRRAQKDGHEGRDKAHRPQPR